MAGSLLRLSQFAFVNSPDQSLSAFHCRRSAREGGTMDFPRFTSIWSPNRFALHLCLLACLSLGGVGTTAPAAADELPDLEARARAAAQTLREADRKLRVAEAAVQVAGKNADKARQPLSDARQALRGARQARATLAEADRGLSEEEKRIEAMVEKLRAIPDDDAHARQRSRLSNLIEAYRKSLRLAAGRYRRARDRLLEQITKLQAAVARAQQAADAAFKAEQDKTAGLNEALLAALGARRQAEAARSRLFRQSLKAPPPYLEEVLVVQGSRTVYHARWEDGFSVCGIVTKVIEGLEAQNEDLLRRLARAKGARERIAGKTKCPTMPEPRLPWTRYEDAYEMGWQLDLAIWTRLRDLRRAGEQFPVLAINVKAYRQQLRKKLFWRLVGAFGLFQAGYHDAKDITGFLGGFQVKRMQELGKERPDIQLDFPRDLLLAIPPEFDTPAAQQLKTDLMWAAARAHRFYHRLDLLDAIRSARETLEGGHLERMKSYYVELRTQIDDSSDPPETKAVKLRRLEAAFAWTSWNVLRAALRMADNEIHKISDHMKEKTEHIDGLFRLLGTVRTRRLRVLTRARLRIGREHEKVKVTVTFTNALAGPPEVLIGEDFPTGSRTLAARVKMAGARDTFAGEFAPELLEAFGDDPGGIRMHVTGKDLAGKQLDANPGTEAYTDAPDTWRNWEESMHEPGRGRGGRDDWHLLNLDPSAGTSYCFVVDVSGSMGQKAKRGQTRLEAVKLAARGFVEKMDKHDEASLWIFSGTGNIRLVVKMTGRTQQVADVLAKQRHGGATALAGAINAGGDYLLIRGKYRNKALVILTDGEETCGGNPQRAAAYFRKLVRIIGYGAGGHLAPPHAAAAGDPDKPKQPKTRPDSRPAATRPKRPKREVVKVQPADRKAYQVGLVRNNAHPSIVVTLTRFHEWGRDGACRVLVTQQKFLVHYGSGVGFGRSWGINSRPFSRRTLAAAGSFQGPAAMDVVRNRYRKLGGMSKENADTKIELHVHKIMDKWEKKEGGS